MNFDFIFFDEIKSTNDFAKEKKIKSPTVIMARVQSGGRGRMGRTFISEEGGLYFSAVLPTGYLSCSLSLCTAAAAVAVRRVLFEKTGKPLCIKWVNDILLDGKKVCGILAETVYTGDTHRTVIGIGINCGDENSVLPDEIKDIATSIYDETGILPDRCALCAEIIKALDTIDSLDRDEIFNEYSENCITVGKNVRVFSEFYESDGKIIAINPDFSLEFLSENGEKRCIYSGEVSVKPR